MDEQERQALTSRVLASLTPQERRLLIDNGQQGDPTIEDLEKQLEKTRQRIQQIEAKALRKPQNPQDD